MNRHAMLIGAAILATLLMTTSAHPQCDPDFNGDSNVDGADLSVMLASWGRCGGECPSDLDQNGIVDGADLTVLLALWGACSDGDSQGDGPFNYGEALQKSITFYAAQRAGDLEGRSRLNWRSDCFNYVLEQENGSYVVDPKILDRYMDAGDSPTFVLPISSAMTTMAWSGLEFGEGYRSANQMDDLLETLRWHADWCIAAHPQPDVFCGQIGQGGPAHSFWLPLGSSFAPLRGGGAPASALQRAGRPT